MRTIGDGEKARNVLIEVVRNEPSNYRAWLNLGRTYFNMNVIDSAQLCMQKSVDINPDYALGYLNLGVIAERMKDFPLAVENYSKAIAIEPLNGTLYRYRGLTHYILGDGSKAISDMSRAVDLDGSAEAYYLRSVIRSENEDVSGALAGRSNCGEQGL